MLEIVWTWTIYQKAASDDANLMNCKFFWLKLLPNYIENYKEDINILLSISGFEFISGAKLPSSESVRVN
jgi:hypothetical protein